MDEARRLLAAGQMEAARARVRELAEAGAVAPRALATLAEAVGLGMVAMQAWQEAVARAPEDGDAWLALAELHEERGDGARAEVCRRRAAGLGRSAHVPAAAPEDEPPPPGEPTEGDLVRFCHLFSGREDVHARMWRDPNRGVGYSPVPTPMTPDLVRAHVRGSMTLGVYFVRRDDTASMLCLDLDVTRVALDAAQGDAATTTRMRAEVAAEGLKILAGLRELGLDPLFEDSGFKGRHFWIFFDGPVPAARVVAVGRRLLTRLRPASPRLALELFPKQAQVRDGGIGNLVKLPLGLHLRSGRRAALLDEAGSVIADPFPRLRAVRRIAITTIEAALSGVAEAPELAASGPAPAPAPAPPAVAAPSEPDWTEADYDASPRVSAVMRGCAVVREIVRRALSERAMDRDSSVVLVHSLGHFADGPRAVNYAMDRVPGFGAEAKMGAPNRGSPVSCAKVRQRVPEIAARVGCACALAPGPGEYPNPLLHASGAPTQPTADRSLDAACEAFGRLLDRQRLVEEEVGAMRRALVARLTSVPGRRWRTQGGEWVLDDEEGLPVLRWVPG
jgi:hypothetical protein